MLGTPAEEGGGGKVFMIERGAFADVDAAMMVHPADRDLRTMTTMAIHQLMARYEGRAAHAAAAPWAGANALDAAVLGYMNLAALRQHIRPDERVHGIFTKAGSPMYSARSAKARRITSVKRWYFREELWPNSRTLYRSSMLSISMSATPPELGGGMVTIS